MATFDQCQREYDARTPEDEDACEEGHDWRFTGEAEDGTKFFRCRRCGEEGEGP